MPQPYRQKPGSDIQWGSDAFGARPQAAIGVANVLNTWAHLEYSLAQLAGIITADSHDRVQAGQFSGVVVGRSRTVPLVMSTIDSLSVRLDVTSIFVERRLSEDLIAEWGTLKVAIRKRGGERAKIAHALWGVVDGLPDAVIRMSSDFTDEKDTLYRPSCFKDIAQRIHADIVAVTGFQSKVMDWLADNPTPQEG